MNDTTSNSTRPIRVLYIARAPFISGAERALMSMLRHLDRSRIEPHLALGQESELVQQAKELDIPVTMLAVPKRTPATLLGWWRSLWRLTKLVKEFQPDVMHANDVPSCQAMSVVGRKQGVPRVVHVRWVISAEGAGWWARDGAEVMLCISQWIRGELGSPVGTPLQSAKYEVLHDAIDWPAVEESSEFKVQSSKLKQKDEQGQNSKLRTLNSELCLGFTGQLIESKGLDMVIAAMGKLPADKQPRLIVAGEDTQTGGVYKEKLQTLAAQCGVSDRIEWLGFVSDVAVVHQRVDAMVCPSRIEPLGLVPLEAARFSVPTIANRTGGLAETIEHGVTGLLTEPGAEAWAATLEQAQDRDALKRMGVAAHVRTKQHFSPAVYQDRLMEIYESVMRTNAKPQAATT